MNLPEFRFEQDTWNSREEMGLETPGTWWWGSRGVPHRLTFNLRYPDKVMHFGAAFLAALVLHRWANLAPALAAGLSFFGWWLALEVRRRPGYVWMGSWKDTVMNAAGAVLAFLVMR